MRRVGRITEPAVVTRVKRLEGALKRWFDVLVAVPLIVFISPLLISLLIACAISSRTMPLRAEKCVGHKGHPFWRLRLVAPPPEAGGIARPLRQFILSGSAARLPELFNVLLGDMSLVGPTPLNRADLDRYGEMRRYYLVARPGLVALWEVAIPSVIGWESRIAFDRDYIEKWTFLRDLRILTLRAGRMRARL
ncbi:MAG: sugar transferase [Caulobacterales bacterium]